jgi:hypothetical protein
MKLPSQFSNPRKESKFASKETNDCVVRALSLVSNLPYENVHKIVRTHLNRKRGRGVKKSLILNLFKNEKALIKKHLNFTAWEMSGVKTINQLIKTKPNGTFFILVRQHATAVIDGKVADTFAKNWHIQNCWQILK